MISRMNHRFALAVCVLFFISGLVGCGSAPVPLHGTVSFNGKPIKKGGITFVTADGASEKITVTDEIQFGEYNIDKTRGLKPGSYKVEIYGTIDEPAAGVDPDLQSSKNENSVPAKYNSKTELTADVEAGVDTLDFDLKP